MAWSVVASSSSHPQWSSNSELWHFCWTKHICLRVVIEPFQSIKRNYFHFLRVSVSLLEYYFQRWVTWQHYCLWAHLAFSISIDWANLILTPDLITCIPSANIYKSPPACFYSSFCTANSIKSAVYSSAVFDRAIRSPHLQTYIIIFYGRLVTNLIEFTWMHCTVPYREWSCPTNCLEEVHLIVMHCCTYSFSHENQ